MARYDVSSGQVSTGIILNNYDSMYVSSGGTANDTTVNSYGCLFISSGGTANSTTVNTSGHMYIYNGGTANSTTVNSWGWLNVSSGGTANYTTVYSIGWLTVSSGGTANNTTVKPSGLLFVSSGGTANYTTVCERGNLTVSSGGTANNTTVKPSGLLFVPSGGAATISYNPWQGIISTYAGAKVTYLAPDANIYYGNDATGILSKYDSLESFVISSGKSVVMVGGTADNTTVKSGGYLYISSGGTATIPYNPWQGKIYSYGGVVTYLAPDANIYYGNDATGILSKYDSLDNFVISAGNAVVMVGGTANYTTVKSGGYLYVSSGGTATISYNPWQGIISTYAGAKVTYLAPDANIYYGNNATGILSKYDSLDNFVISAGNAVVMVGGTANYTTVCERGNLTVSSGGTANNTTVKSGGYLYVSSGGTVDNTSVWGAMIVSRGGTANSITVETGGYLYVSSGGTATISYNPWQGNISTDAGAKVTYLAPDANIYYGDNRLGFLTAYDGLDDFIITSGKTVFVFGGTANSTTVNSLGGMYVSNGGTADNTTVNAAGFLFISSGGTANNTKVNDGYLTVSNGGTADDTTVNAGGSMIISLGGTANSTTVNAAGFLFISSGGTANSTTVSPGGYLYVSSGGKATAIDAKSGASLYLTVAPGTYIQGASAGFAFLIENAFISGYTVNSGDLSVYNGGTAYSTTVNSRGYLFVSRGGTANGVTVNAGGYLIVSSGGTATEIVENGGFVEGIPGASIDFVPTAFSNLVLNSGSATVHSGTTAVSAKVEGYYANMYIYTGGSTVSTTVSSGGTLHIYNGGTASRNTINGVGYLIVSSGGMANENTVNKYGLLYVSSGGTANNATVNWGGSLSVSSGGKITGRLEIASGAVVSAYANAVVDFNIVNQTVSDDYLINDLSRLSGNPNYTITVSSGQDFGRYKLAQGAASFNRTISIGDGTSVYGNLTVNGNMLRYEGRDYALVKNGENLLLDVIEKDDVPPDAPQAFADVTSATNGNVVVTAIFADDSVKNEYSLNNIDWNNYISGYRFTSNGTIYFRSTDKAGNISEVTTYTVSNIDTTPPARPTVSVSTDQWTNENVIVTAIFADDSTRNEYSINDGEWNDYSGPLEMEVNGSVSFRSADAAGNISQTANYNVANIDKTLPTLSISGNAENWTNQNVVLTASATDDDSGVRSLEYSFDHENWTTGFSVPVEQNATVYFRATDNAGNIREDSVFVDKIDKAGPEISFVGFSGNWINDTTTVTAVAEDGLSGVESIEYSFDDSTWISGASVTISEASIIYFRALDNVGNVSTKNLAIQIDQFRPTLSISGNAVNWTNQNVVLTATAADDASGVRSVEFSFDRENWTAGSSVTVEQNGTVYFRATDNAGNTTEDSVAVTKINKTAPVFQNIALSSEDWTFDPITATPQVTDDIDITVTFRIGNGIEQTLTNGTITLDSPAYVYFTATDAAGNSSTASAYVKAGYVPVSSGSTFSGLTVSRGVLDVLNGGVAKDFSVFFGGTLVNSGTVSGLHASSGADISGEGRFYLTSDTEIAAGVMWQNRDQSLIGASTFSGFVAASDWHVDQDLLLKEAAVASGGSMTLHQGASATILNNSGYAEVLSKANARSVTVNSGAELKINGGVAAAVTISHGGLETLTNGGSGLRTSVYGSQEVRNNGTANSTTVYANGTQTVGVHGLAKSGYVSSGGVQQVYGGSSYRDQILPGGSQVIADNGTASETSVTAGFQIILSNGSAERTEIIRGSQYISSGGLAENTTVSGVMKTYSSTLTSSYQYSGDRIYWTGTGDSTSVISSSWAAAETSSAKVYYYDYSGSQFVSNGGLASATTLTSGSIQTVFAGGRAVETTVNANAFQYVLKDGSAFKTEVGSRGIYAIEYDGYGEDVTVADSGSFVLHGTVKNLTLAKTAAYYFDLGTAVFQGNLDCYLNPSELGVLNEILMFSELASLTLRVNASSFGQDQYDAFNTESNEALDYRFMLVLDDGKAVSLRDNTHYWYNGEHYSLNYSEDEHQYYMNKATQSRTKVLLSSSGNIDDLESQSGKVIWSRNSYQDYGEVIAVQETGAGKTVYVNTGISVRGLLQNAAAVDFSAGGGILQFGTKTFTVDMYSRDNAESIVYGIHNAAVIQRRLASEQALPDNVTMNISAAAVDGSACAAAFVNDSAGMVFSGGIAGAMNVNAAGNTADARGIFTAGSTTITEPVTGSSLIQAEATGGAAYAQGASLLDADDLDMTWEISAESAESNALAAGIAARNLGQWTAVGKLQVTASAGKNATAYGFAASDHRGGAAVSKFMVSEVFGGSLQVAASGDNAEAVGVESQLELGCDMAAGIGVTATGKSDAYALGLNSLNQTTVNGEIEVKASGANQAKAVGIGAVDNTDLAGEFSVSAKSSARDAQSTGWLGAAGTLSSDVTIYAEGSNSVRAFAFVDDFDSASGGSLNTLAENGTINVTARSINVDNPSMAPVYAIGGRIDNTVAGSICVSAVAADTEQETHAKAVHAETISVSGIAGASAATQAVAVAANSESTKLTMSVTGVLFAGDAALNGDNAAMLTLLRNPWENLATLIAAKDRTAYQAYAMYAYDEDDEVTIGQNAVVIGDMEFAGGSNTLTISNGAYLYGDLNAENGSLTVNFTLDSMRTDHAVITGDINTGGDSTLSVDISGIRSSGRYVLISGSVPAATTSTIAVKYYGGSTVLTENADFTTINNYGKYRYYRDGGDLIFEAKGLVQANITVTSNISNQTITNQDVVLTAEFSSVADITARQYKINNGAWMNYTGSVTVNENSTVSFRLIDNEMNEVVEQYAVTNIDKTAPVISSITPSITAETAGPVVVTAEFSDNVELASRQYRIGEDAWQNYINGVTVSQNATVYFRATDTAGNETTDYIVIGNIKTTLPVITLNGNNVSLAESALLTASSDSGNPIYYNTISSDYKGTWSVYRSPITVTANQTYYFQTTDNAGNTGTASIVFSNIDKVAPEAPVANADITAPTNQNVTVTATFSNDTATKQYSRDNSTWQTYTTGIVMQNNGTVYFRGIDAAGNISQVASYQVSNIDKVAPVKPTAAADITTPTNQNVTVTATFSADSARKQYSLNNSTWNTYTAGVVMSANGTVYFRGIDAAGNISPVASYQVNNIDKVAPTKPSTSANITTPTNQNVTVTATFSTDTATKQYSLNNSTWNTYTSGIVMQNNGTVYFRGIDAAGNISQVASYQVNNIDKVAPTKPSASANITTPTNQNVTVSATFSADSARKQYSLNNSTWSNYTAGVVFAENGTVWFRGIDAAGNISEVTSYTVGNIQTDDFEISGNQSGSQGIPLNNPGKYTLTGDFGDINGTVTVLNGGKKAGTGTIKNGVLTFNKGNPVLLDSALETVIQVTVKNGTNTNYTATLAAETVFNQGDADSRENRSWAGSVSEAGPLVGDGRVGFGDEVDYHSFTLDNAANLVLDYTSTDAAKFTLFNAATGKSVMSSTLKAGNFTAKPKLLEKGQYYLEVQSTNAKKGGDAHYTVGVNKSTVFFTKGNPQDDAWNSAVDQGTVTVAPADLTADWVGFGDEVDYRKFALVSGAKLNFTVNASDAAKFTVWQMQNGKLKSLQNVSVKAGQTLDTKDLWLEKGEYYYSMQSTNAKKGGNADYTVTLNGNSKFFTEGDNTNDTWQAVSGQEAKLPGEEITGWVGFGDASDFIKFAVEEDGRIQLNLDKDTKNALASKQIKLTCLDENGKSVAIAVDKNDPYTVLSKKDVARGEYYLGVTCANVKKYDTTYSITTGQLTS